jgi:hypothetical protein
MASGLHTALREARLALPEDADLRSEMLALRLVETTVGMRVDHKSGAHDDRCTAVGICMMHLLSGSASARAWIDTSVTGYTGGLGFGRSGAGFERGLRDQNRLARSSVR